MNVTDRVIGFSDAQIDQHRRILEEYHEPPLPSCNLCLAYDARQLSAREKAWRELIEYSSELGQRTVGSFTEEEWRESKRRMVDLLDAVRREEEKRDQ